MPSDKSLEKIPGNRSSARTDAFFRAPGQFLSDEIHALPYNDIPSAVTLALQQLELINRLRIDATQREEAVRPFNFAWRKFHAYYAELRTTQKYVRQADAGELDQFGKFTRCLSYGYQLAVEGLLGLESRHSHIAQLSLNAMFFIGQAMLHAYARYSWVEPGLWQQLHHLFRSAELEKCEDIAVSSPLDSACKLSIKQLYVQIALLSLADPYHLPQGDVWLLQRYLERWAGGVRLIPPNESNTEKACFCVSLYSQLRPFPASALKNLNQDGLRWLLVEPLERQLRLHLNLLRNGQATNVLDIAISLPAGKALDLLERALVSWVYTPSRQSPRVVDASSVAIAWTLNDIFQLLQSQQRGQPDRPPLRLLNKAWGTTENLSDTGMRLLIEHRPQQAPSVGDVLAVLISQPQRRQLRVGIVQWTAQNESGHSMRCGIQLIEGIPQPAWLEVDDAPVRQAILVVRQGTEEPASSLIAPAGFLTAGKNILVSTPAMEGAFEIKPICFLLQTDQIDHCRFDTLNVPA